MNVDWQVLAADIRKRAGLVLEPTHSTPVHGGSINSACRTETDRGPAFLKLNASELAPMFAAEAEGLAELDGAGCVRVPRALAWGIVGSRAYLLLEWLDFGPGSRDCAHRLGAQLAAQHRVSADRYGWRIDNTIGRILQRNEWTDQWIDFFRRHRLGYQLDLAARNGYTGHLQQRGEQLLECVDDFFGDYRPSASLLHGDLWGGNWACDQRGQPVIFDPAVYYGDREADIAMTELFGGFDAAFYSAYNAAWPLEPGYRIRRDLYNLYHVLNHLNLFGGGYRRQAEHTLDRLLAVVGH